MHLHQEATSGHRLNDMISLIHTTGYRAACHALFSLAATSRFLTAWSYTSILDFLWDLDLQTFFNHFCCCGVFLFCSQWLKKMWWLCLSSAVVVAFIFFLEHETALCISLQPKKIRGKLTQMDFSFERTCKSHNTKTYFELVQCSHTVLPAYVFLNLPVYRIWIGLLYKKYKTEYHTIRFSVLVSLNVYTSILEFLLTIT